MGGFWIFEFEDDPFVYVDDAIVHVDTDDNPDYGTGSNADNHRYHYILA